MKVLQIAPPWIGIPPQNYGGTEWIIANLIKQLHQDGHQVTLFGTGNSRTPATLKYVYQTGLFEQNDKEWSLMQPALALPALVHYDQAFKEAATGKYDIVHAHLSAGTDLMKLKFLAELKVPYIATTHMVFPFDKWSNKDDQYIKYYANNIRLVFISQTQAKLYPPEFNKLGVVHNSLDLSLMRYQQKPAGWNNQPYLTWLGKIMPWKGLDVAIHVAKKLNMKLIFAGVLDETNHPESKVYFDQKIKPHIDGQQIQYIGPADLDTKNKLLANATAFLNPISWSEPFGMVAIEAMSTGTPVISFAKGGPIEIIEHGKTGFLVNTAEQMAQAVTKINTIKRADCRHAVEQRFSARAMTQNYLHLYRQSITEHKLKSMVATQAGKPLYRRPVKVTKKRQPQD